MHISPKEGKSGENRILLLVGDRNEDYPELGIAELQLENLHHWPTEKERLATKWRQGKSLPWGDTTYLLAMAKAEASRITSLFWIGHGRLKLTMAKADTTCLFPWGLYPWHSDTASRAKAIQFYTRNCEVSRRRIAGVGRDRRSAHAWRRQLE